MPKHKPPKEPVQVEHKVTAAAGASALFSALVAYVVANPDQFTWCPLWAKTLILFATGTFGIGGAAFTAPHTARTDLPAAEYVDPTEGLDSP